MSITTKTGDTGHTSLAGTVRVSKTDSRVEASGSLDELNSAMGFARSITDDSDIKVLVKRIQRELFVIGSNLANDVERVPPPIDDRMVDALTRDVYRLEQMEGIVADWCIPGEHPASGAFDVARSVCRRAERDVVRLVESGKSVNPHVIAYLNRLSDLLWVIGRYIELRTGVDSRLRDKNDTGAHWSRAW
jgi:cob(I)alamin adenosyltransferase